MCNWTSFNQELPPENTEVLALRIGADQAVFGTYRITSLGSMEIMKRRGDSMYPGGASIKWFSHWMPLPERPPDAVIVKSG